MSGSSHTDRSLKHLFDDLTLEQKERLAKAVLEFDETDICQEGRKRFLYTYGFPTPPVKGMVTIYLEFSLDAKEIDDGIISDREVSRRESEIKEALEPLGYSFDSRGSYSPEFDYEEED